MDSDTYNELRDLSYGAVKRAFLNAGYKFFYSVFDLNIFGVRGCNRNAGEFDDVIGAAFHDGDIGHVKMYRATTDPSKKWLLKPLHPNGTIVITTGQYLGVYKKGIHGRSWASGGYPALEQYGNFSYVRDKNFDSVVDIECLPSFKDNAKTNLHRANKWKIVDKIGSYSAGCQVVQDPEDYDDLMVLLDQQIRHLGVNSFSYTLFNINEFKKLTGA